MPPPYRSYVLVSLDRIARNYRNVRAAVGPGVEVMAVVKANAYGHGALAVSRTLVGEGAKWLAVSSVDEGVALRTAGIAARILVMAGFPAARAGSGGAARSDANRAFARATSRNWIVWRARRAAAAPSPEDRQRHGEAGHTRAAAGNRRCASRLAARAPGRPDDPLRLGGGFHFAANRPAVGPVPGVSGGGTRGRHGRRLRTHILSTNAIGYGRKDAWHNMVRAGTRCTVMSRRPRGGGPGQILDVQPALTWKAKILAVKDIPEGTLVGYGGTFRAPAAMRIAILGAGYADGVFHTALESRQGDRGRADRPDRGHHLDGPDHHRYQRGA